MRRKLKQTQMSTYVNIWKKKRKGKASEPVVRALIKAARRPLKSLKTSSTVRGTGCGMASIFALSLCVSTSQSQSQSQCQLIAIAQSEEHGDANDAIELASYCGIEIRVC